MRWLSGTGAALYKHTGRVFIADKRLSFTRAASPSPDNKVQTICFVIVLPWRYQACKPQTKGHYQWCRVLPARLTTCSQKIQTPLPWNASLSTWNILTNIMHTLLGTWAQTRCGIDSTGGWKVSFLPLSLCFSHCWYTLLTNILEQPTKMRL